MERKSKCINRCKFLALYDPLDTYFYEEYDHENTETDVMVENAIHYFNSS